MLGEEEDDDNGYSVGGGFDINSDGFYDAIIGAPQFSDSGKGASYLIYGTNSIDGTINLGSLVEAQGYAVYGTENDFIGYSVSGIGDFNNDGYEDFIIGGTYGGYQLQTTPGVCYVIYGTDNGSTRAPTTNPTHAPTIEDTSFPTLFPSIVPTAQYLNIDITTGGTYVGTAANENFVIDSSQDTTISGGDGDDMFTFLEHSGVNTTITDFDEINELINLVAFSNINNIKDLTIVSSPTTIYLDNNQKVILENLTPTDLTEDNFIFASGPTDQSNDNSANDIKGSLKDSF